MKPSPAPHRSGLRGRRARFVAVTLGLVLLLALPLGEGLLRLATLLHPPLGRHTIDELGHRATGHRYLHDPLLGWRNIPGWRTTTFGQPLSINALGLRGPATTRAKAPGSRRLLLLGDSFVWGFRVGDAQVLSAALQRRLAGARPAVEVLNGAVSGWGTDQQFLYLFSEGLALEPDLVLLFFFLPNDPINNANAMQYGMAKPYFPDRRLQVAGVPVPYLALTGAGRYAAVSPAPPCRASALCHYLLRRSLGRPPWLDAMTGLGLARVAPPPTVELRENPLELSLALLRAADELCRERGVRLVVVKFGAFLRGADEAQWQSPLQLDIERQFLSGLRVQLPRTPVLDLDAAYREQGLSAHALTRGGDSWHWNAFGHRVTAAIVHRFLARQGLQQAIVPERR